jgi:DNA transposition AAA+ family ATPase
MPDTSAQNPFLETRAARQAWRALEASRASREVSLLLGAPGAGKSSILAAYLRRVNTARSLPAVLLYRAEVVNTPLSLVGALLERLGVRWNGTTRAGCELFAVLVRHFGVEQLLVDDTQALARNTLEMLRHLREQTGLGLVMAGTERLPRQLGRKCPSLARQVESMREVGALALADVLKLLGERTSLRGSRPWERVATARGLLEAAEGSFHRLLRLLMEARRLARIQHRPVTIAIVRKALEERRVA